MLKGIGKSIKKKKRRSTRLVVSEIRKHKTVRPHWQEGPTALTNGGEAENKCVSGEESEKKGKPCLMTSCHHDD